MAEKKFVYHQVVDVKRNSGDLKQQITIDVSPYDTSEMEGYKEGQQVYKGLTCRISVTKFGTNPKSSFINFDPTDVNIEKAIKQMYDEVHKSSKK